MSPNDPALQVLIDRVQSAISGGAQLDIRGGGTKAFYGEPGRGGEQAAIEFWQTKRDGGLRGIVEIA